MRRIKKILDIEHEIISYKDNSPLAVELLNIKHSSVHVHDSDLEMVLCLKGTIDIYCNHQWTTLSDGEIYTIVERDIHCIWSDADNITAILHIDTSNPVVARVELHNAYIACEDSSCQSLQCEYINRVKAIILALVYKKEFNILNKEAAIKVTKEITELLIGHFNWFSFKDNYPDSNLRLYERMISIVDYCETNYMEKLTISKLARSIHISENYFSQFFKHCPYGSFSLMLGYIRCFYAQELLLSTELPVINIAQQCGFSDVKYMYKHFKYWWKKTPNEYRQWFSEYIKTPVSIKPLDEDDARDFIQSYAARIFSKFIIS